MGIQSLNRAELLGLLRAANETNRLHWLAILMAFSHGLRSSEVTAIKRNDIDGDCLTVKRLKGSMKTSQSLIEHSEPLLNEKTAVLNLIAGYYPNQRLFPWSRWTQWRLVHKYALQSGLPKHKANNKVLKHSIAMQIIHIAGIENTKQYLGHKSLSSTGAYLKVTDADASAAARAALSRSNVD